MVQMHITDRINRISRGYKTDEDENSTYGVEQLGLVMERLLQKIWYDGTLNLWLII